MAISEILTGKSNERAVLMLTLTDTPYLYIHRMGQTIHTPGALVSHCRVKITHTETPSPGKTVATFVDETNAPYKVLIANGRVIHPVFTF